MEVKTQQDALGKQLQDAVMQAAIDQAVSNNANANDSQSADTDSAVSNEMRAGSETKPWNPMHGKKPRAVSPLTGAPTPPGKPKGVKNRLTNIRDAVLEAFDTVGGAEYLVRLANGTQSDRAAFTGLVAKVLPTQIQANVEGGIKLELSWLGGRSIGATAAQLPEQRTQVLDLQRDSDGSYRINDPAPDGGQAQGESTAAQGSVGDAQGEQAT